MLLYVFTTILKINNYAIFIFVYFIIYIAIFCNNRCSMNNAQESHMNDIMHKTMR